MSVRRWTLISLGAFALTLLCACLALKPLTRHYAQSQAANLGLELTIQSVAPCLQGLRLDHVNITCPEIPSLTLHIQQITVTPKTFRIHQANATISTDYTAFRDQVKRWQSKRQPDSTQSTRKKRRTIALDSLDLAWPSFAGPESSLVLKGIRVSNLLERDSIFVASLEAVHPRLKVEAEALNCVFSQPLAFQVQSIQAKYLSAELKIGENKPTDAQAGMPASLRDRISKGAQSAWSIMTPASTLNIDGLKVSVHRGNEVIQFGPGVFAAQQKENAVLVDLAPKVEKDAKGISFRGALPLGEGPVIVDVVGGPISLATLGVQEGNLGLKNVREVTLSADTHLKLHEDGRNMSFDGTVRAKNIGIAHPRLASDPVIGLEIAAKLRGQASLDGKLFQFEEAQLEVGKVQFQFRGVFDQTAAQMNADLHFGIPLVACQDLLDALPQSLIPVVYGLTSAGTLSLSGHLKYNEANADDFKLEYAFSNDCRITSVPKHIDVRRFSAPFKLLTYDAKGTPVEIELGPGAPGWVRRGDINHFIEAAVMTCEDGRFRRHQGFDHEAIRNSVRDNLRARKFLRGASTISMQLGKNLYLTRDKTISRKLQELILTTYLEQALTKDEIMGLYLNVVEFAPMTHGLGLASAHYFNAQPGSLSLSQAMYLASVLPNPKQQHFVQEGRVSDGWMRYLYKLMRIASKMRWISEQELEEGLGEWVVRGSPEPVRTALPSEESGVGADQEDEPFGWKRKDSPVY